MGFKRRAAIIALRDSPSKNQGKEKTVTAQEIQKRNEKAQQLRVLQTESGKLYVESGEGKILYHVAPQGEESSEYLCTCEDFAAHIKKDSTFQCKHILAAMNCVLNGPTENATFLEKSRPRLDERFIKTIEGRDFVLYSGLLDLAHQKGLLKVTVESLQLPAKENGYMAICKAVAQSRFGTFTDIGDANPSNCNARVGKHLLRMASTRAKARALRDLTNIGMTCLEELGDLNDEVGDDGAQAKPKTKKIPARSSGSKTTKARKKQEYEHKTGQTTSGSKDSFTQTQAPEANLEMSEAQKRAIYNLSRRRGMSIEALEAMSAEMYGVNLDHLSFNDAASLIRHLQAAA